MCAEAVWWRCHRREALHMRGDAMSREEGDRLVQLLN